MSEIYKMCYDKILPGDLRRFASPEFTDPVARMAVFKAKKWPNGSTIRIRFMGGSVEQQDFVRQFAPEWTEYANLKFDFTNAANAEIRISFLDDGAWSYIGIDALDIPIHAATMNFGWLERGTVLHEFGHAIGLIHEHQNPAGGIQWNRENVISDLSKPPNNWPLAVIERNVFQKYSVDQLNATALDKKSIMLYAIPSRWTLDGFSSEPNNVLSETDKTFIGDEKNYPPSGDNDNIVELPIFEAKVTEAAIGQPGEQDLFSFNAATTGQYKVETEGPTDIIMSLYGPNSRTTLIAQDDDSGADRNAKIVVDVDTIGIYYVQVRHFNTASGVGSYRIKVSK